jgi:hypothetical protein
VPTGESPDPSVCLAAVIDDVIFADDVVVCVPSEGEWSGLEDETFCSDEMVTVDVSCIVAAIAVDGAASAVALRCSADDGTRRLLELSSRHVARGTIQNVEEWGECGEGDLPPELDLALIDP